MVESVFVMCIENVNKTSKFKKPNDFGQANEIAEKKL